MRQRGRPLDRGDPGAFGVLNAYRCLLLFSRGEFRPFRSLKDALIAEGQEKDLHPWQQPLGEARYFVERLCPPGGLVCDPFVGSGTTARAVILAGGGRRYLGCDVSGEAVGKARRRVASAIDAVGEESACLV